MNRERDYLRGLWKWELMPWLAALALVLGLLWKLWKTLPW